MTASIHLIPVDSDEGRQVAAELRADGGITVLAGSAISSFEPSGIPMGGKFSAAISAHLAEKSANADTLKDVLWYTAFEHIMERCPAPEVVRRELSLALRDTPPNDVHTAFARLTEANVVRHIVTTNYDTGLENAFETCCPTLDVAYVRRRNEARRLRGGEPHVLFKIHGCARPHVRRTIVFRLRDEAELPAWKRELLGALVRDRPLLVAGYSGMDFEICPELARMGASRVVWLTFREPDLNANSRAVIARTGATVMVGDVQKLVTELGASSNAPISGAPPTVIDNIFAALTPRDVDLWRTRLFGEIGCGEEAAAAAQRLLASATNDVEQAEARQEHARAIFAMGHYLDAAEEYRACADVLGRHGETGARIGALHGLAEASRCAGRFIQARRAIREVERIASDGPEPHGSQAAMSAAVLRLTLRWHLFQILSRIPGEPGVRRVRAAALRDLQSVAGPAAARGGWMFLAQMRLWADRYGIPWDQVYTGPMQIVEAGASYGQLGYITARTMALRDRVARGQATPSDFEKVEEHFQTLHAIGSRAEAWKFARVVQRMLGRGALSDDARAKAAEARRNCQYTPLMRLLHCITPS
jgi:hypothetical protein